VHPACLPISELIEVCVVERLKQKGSGAGGQRKNKVQTAVRVTHTPTGLFAQAAERREPEVNRKQAVFRLRIRLAVEHRTGLGFERLPTNRWLKRIKNRRLLVNPSHEDFPALLAEAIEVLAQEEWDVVLAAQRLQVSTSQLVKLLAKESKALAMVNKHRLARGAAALRAG